MGAVTKGWLRLGGCGLMWVALAGVVPAQETEPEAEAPVQAPVENGEVEAEPKPAADTALPQHTHIEPRQNIATALRQQLPESQQRWLTDSQGEFLALYQPQNRAQPMGAVLIVHDLGQHPDWPHVVRPLRQGLPDQGWHTLSIMLPEAPGLSVPDRVLATRSATAKAEPETTDEPAAPDTPDTAENPEDEPSADNEPASEAEAATIQLQGAASQDNTPEPVPSFEEQVMGRIEAGLMHLQEKGLANIVLIGVGDSARLVTLFLARNPEYRDQKGMTLVWIDPRLEPAERVDFLQLLGDPPYPRILDVADTLVPERRANAKDRLRSARRLRLDNYVQVNLPLRGGDTVRQDAALLHRLRGWLEVNAPGEARRNNRGPAGP